jgi:putative endonuclease
MTSVATGRQAEDAAANYLRSKGYAILDQNWRTPLCEIDIVAKYRGALYFYEVKYRQSTAQGGGLEYITPKKLAQMRFAAQAWVHLHAWRGEYQLAAIEVSGLEFAVTACVEEL